MAIAGTKGFGGGYGPALADDFGEPEMKGWIRHAERRRKRWRMSSPRSSAMSASCYSTTSPTVETLDGERLELYPFLGNSMLGEAIDRSGADLVVHGHAHHGSLAGMTPGGVPVRNVAQSVIRAPYVVFTIEREDEASPRRSLRRRRGDDLNDGDSSPGSRERDRGTRRPRWLRRGTRIDDEPPQTRKGRRR